MNVAQLIRKLQRMPQDAIVTIPNEHLYFDGEYEVTSIETYDCQTVELCTDYEHRMEEEQKDG